LHLAANIELPPPPPPRTSKGENNKKNNDDDENAVLSLECTRTLHDQLSRLA